MFPSVIGLDIGGTKVAGQVRTPDGRVATSVWRAHRARGHAEVCDLLIGIIAELDAACAASGLELPAAVGVSVAAWVAGQPPLIRRAANLHIDSLDLTHALSERVARPVTVENDGNAAALAEQRLHHPEARCLLGLSIGTGLGAGIVVDGQLFRGAVGLGAELGHVRIGDADDPCICGGTACAELYVSGGGVAAIAARRGLPRRTVSDLLVAARTGEDRAARLLADAGRALGRLLAIAVPILDPDVIVLGGSVGDAAADLLIPIATDTLAERIGLKGVAELAPLTRSRAGPTAAAVGAALLAAGSPLVPPMAPHALGDRNT